MEDNQIVVILVSADAEWQAVCDMYPGEQMEPSPYGEWFCLQEENVDLIFFHGGWGKIAAAGSTQYAIDRWCPELLINFGTCGGFAGKIDLNTIVLADRTIVYDIYEQMGDPEAHIASYITDLDLSWLGEPFPLPVRKSLLVSGDRDLHAKEISKLAQRYGAVAGDWESGAIAYVAAHNNTACLILRAVSDLVGENGSDAYGDLDFFAERARLIMASLVNSLPGWLKCAGLLATEPSDSGDAPGAPDEK
jgi:adenosylhomocysteine nucleosidase